MICHIAMIPCFVFWGFGEPMSTKVIVFWKTCFFINLTYLIYYMFIEIDNFLTNDVSWKYFKVNHVTWIGVDVLDFTLTCILRSRRDSGTIILSKLYINWYIFFFFFSYNITSFTCLAHCWLLLLGPQGM